MILNCDTETINLCPFVYNVLNVIVPWEILVLGTSDFSNRGICSMVSVKYRTFLLPMEQTKKSVQHLKPAKSYKKTVNPLHSTITSYDTIV